MSQKSRPQKRCDPAPVPICPQAELPRRDYWEDLLRLRNILAALARPAPMIASQGVSLARAASRTFVSSLDGGGLRGRESAIKASSNSAMANNTPPAIAYATATPNPATRECASAKPNKPKPKKTTHNMMAIKTALPISRPNMKFLRGLPCSYIRQPGLTGKQP